MHGYGYLYLEEAYNLYSSFSGEGEGVISDHKYSGYNNSVRVEFLVVSATFWFTDEGKSVFCFCFNYNMF